MSEENYVEDFSSLLQDAKSAVPQLILHALGAAEQGDDQASMRLTQAACNAANALCALSSLKTTTSHLSKPD